MKQHMWKCPKCGREFKRTNQGHYCGKAPETVDEYVDAQAQEAQAHVMELRSIIQRCVPDVRERIAWSMPVFEMGKRSISFAACQKHISLYLDAETIEIIQPQLSDFTIKKNALYLPYSKELPISAIENAVKVYFETESIIGTG